MQFSLAVLFGALVGSILLIATRRKKPTDTAPSARSNWSTWLTLALGGAAAFVFAGAMIDSARTPNVLWLASIALPVATMTLGVGDLVRKDRRWPTFLGLALGLLPSLSWVVFLIGEVLGPAH